MGLGTSTTGTRSQSARPLSVSRRAGGRKWPIRPSRFLEYVFLALLYLFFLRVLRAVWVELREPRGRPCGAQPRDRRRSPRLQQRGTQGRTRWPPPIGRREPERGKGTGVPPRQTSSLSADRRLRRPPAVGRFVSQVHARLFRRGDEYWVEDLGSHQRHPDERSQVGRSRPTAKG